MESGSGQVARLVELVNGGWVLMASRRGPGDSRAGFKL